MPGMCAHIQVHLSGLSLHTTVCKHIHTIGMNSHQSKQNNLNSLTNDINYFTSVMGGTETQDRAPTTQSRVIKLVDFAVRNCLDIEALKASQQHLRAALTVISAIEQSPKDINPPKKIKIAANTNTPKQLRFFSTNKRNLNQPSYQNQPMINKSALKRFFNN